MSEMGSSYDPGPWKGYNFKSARAAYKGFDSDAGRGYTTPKSKVVNIDDHVPERIHTDAKSPLVVMVDGTGSMGSFPKTIFEKLPLLDLGVEDYLDDVEISFGMIGDASYDKYPLQVQEFTKGKGLVDSLNELIIEKGGGGNEEESYDLGALYYARNVEMPNAINPVLIYVCDEGIYPKVDKEWAKNYARVDLEKALKSEELFDELKQKYSLYCVRKHYNGGISGDTMTGPNKRIHEQWQRFVGEDRVAVLNDPKRIVDVIFGLLGYETDKMDFFEKELTYRQKPDQVATVMNTMLTIGATPRLLKKGKSLLLRDDDDKVEQSTELL